MKKNYWKAENFQPVKNILAKPKTACMDAWREHCNYYDVIIALIEEFLSTKKLAKDEQKKRMRNF